MDSDTLQKYKKLQGRFKLPQLNELKATFKFEPVTDEGIFDQIRTEISEKMFNFTEKIIEPMITGSDLLCCMFEQNMVSTKEKETLFRLYRKIQVLKWENNLLMIKPNEIETAKWIRKAWEFWNTELEYELTSLCKKLSFDWDNLKIENRKTYYHG